jgi:serralysin
MSIMSYKNPPASSTISVIGTQFVNGGYSTSRSLSSVNPSTYGVFDIAAMQYLYGANKSTVATELSVTDDFFQNADTGNRQADYRTVWAPKETGGIKVDASTTTRANLFDLREGAYSSVAIKTTADYQAAIRASLKTQGFNDANATKAASAIVKRDGSQLYNGKNNLALAYGSKYSEVNGGSANDAFYASNYSAIVDGNGGTDTLYLTGKATDWTINQAAGTATNKANQAVITYRNIENIAYYKSTASVLHA